jgi:hypothetical protein
MTTPAVTPPASMDFEQMAAADAAKSQSSSTSTVPATPTALPTAGMDFEQMAQQDAARVADTSRAGTTPTDRTSVGVGSVNTERLHNLGQGLQETGHDVWGAIKGLATSTPPGVSELHEGIQEAIPSFHAYENARSQGKGVWESIKAANDEMARQQDARDVLKQRIEEFKKNPQVASIRAIGDAAAMAAAAYGGAKLGVPEAGTTFDTETGNLVSPTTETAAVPKPGIVSTVKNLKNEIVQGAKVAQPGAQEAVRDVVPTGTAEEIPLVKGNKTFMDDHLSDIEQQKIAAYEKIDDVSGFDVKALKDKLKTDQYNLKQLGSSDPDKTGRLVEAINDSTDRLAEANEKLKVAGVDPDSADALNARWKAGEDFKKSLVKNTNPADQSVNVDGLLKDAKNLRFNKYGDRLEQFMGKEGADKYVSQLEEMQQLGAHAVKAQKIAMWLGKYVLPEVVGGAVATGYALSK